MNTQVILLDPHQPDPAQIQAAARVLRAGGLVAFPTETVYGLGANALDDAAVRRIYEAKGRPASNPVIVHVADALAVRPLVREFCDVAQVLADHFWPGPLTLVLPRSERVPDVVTAGGPTVAVRIPKHPLALALLREVGLPIAAPSANRSTCLSPTRAEHVRSGLGGHIDMILDGGPCSGGLESTVLDVTTDPPRLLRPGLVTLTQLQAIVGRIEVGPSCSEEPARSPGLLERHYAPCTPLVLANDNGMSLVDSLTRQGKRVGWVTMESTSHEGAVVRVMSADPAVYASNLYDMLHQLDQMGLDRIVVSLPPQGDAWSAVHDRLRRAS